MVSRHYELVVVGAGPAGLAAATTAANLGMDVTLLDEQAAPGGQIYRAVEQAPDERARLLSPDYHQGLELVEAFRASGARYLPDTAVWSLGTDREIGVLHAGRASLVSAGHVIIAGGAMERPVPFPGWTLPGVMNAGAAQILMKSSGTVPANGTVIAGTGPLLLLLAWQYLRAGVPVKAVLEMATPGDFVRAAPRLPAALLAGHYITRGMKYLWQLRRAGIPVRYAVSGLRALGDARLHTVAYEQGGRRSIIETDSLLVHFGLVPNVQLTEAAGCRHTWDDGQQCWRPEVDEWGNTSVAGIAVAGDNAAIGGALTAAHAGRLAALEAGRALGHIDAQERDTRGKDDRSWMLEDLRIRPFLEALHRLPPSLLATRDDDTLVCRCEEITAGEIRRAVREGHTDPNQVKFITRCGMGPCQGRQCSHALAHIVAAETGQPMGAQNPLRVRPPVRPVGIDALGALETGEESV